MTDASTPSPTTGHAGGRSVARGAAAAIGAWGLVVLTPHLTLWSDPVVAATVQTTDRVFVMVFATIVAAWIGDLASGWRTSDRHHAPVAIAAMAIACGLSHLLAIGASSDTRTVIDALRADRAITMSTVDGPDGVTRWVRFAVPSTTTDRRIVIGGASAVIRAGDDGTVVDLRPRRAIALAAALAAHPDDPAARAATGMVEAIAAIR